MTKPISIAIAGLGTVCQGTVKILQHKAELLAQRAGKPIIIHSVSARDRLKDRGLDLSDIHWSDNPWDMATNPDIDIVVELVGGASGMAYDLVKTALENGKHVVTANKALIAEHGVELAKLAEKHNVALAFEAAVAGGIPIIKTLKEGLSGNVFLRIMGIMNGTCNYILTAMREDERAFDDVLKEAQELGYAEADPTFDVDGIDTAHKLAIITSIAFGTPVDTTHMHIEGIRDITLEDIRYATSLDMEIKLLGITEVVEGGISQRVYPVMIPRNWPLARVEGVLNAVSVESDALGPLFLEGAGAGEGPTASSVVADIVDIAAGRYSYPLNIPSDKLEVAHYLGIDAHEGEYYLRLVVEDTPGVLAEISSLFGDHDVSIAEMHQEQTEEGAPVTIILTTHATVESTFSKVLEKISTLQAVIDPPHIIRIER